MSKNELSAYSSEASFESVQRMASQLSTSKIVPANYQGNISDCMVAMEMANRLSVSPLMVMQNLHIIKGKPSWSSTFIISAINSSGRFKSKLKFVYENLGLKKFNYTAWVNKKPTKKEVELANVKCKAYAVDELGDKVYGPAVTIEMAVKEGWYGKTDSKWQTMPELMLSYRAAAFFGRLYCSDILMGMHSADEVTDINNISKDEVDEGKTTILKNVEEKLKPKVEVEAEEAEEIPDIIPKEEDDSLV